MDAAYVAQSFHYVTHSAGGEYNHVSLPAFASENAPTKTETIDAVQAEALSQAQPETAEETEQTEVVISNAAPEALDDVLQFDLSDNTFIFSAADLLVNDTDAENDSLSLQSISAQHGNIVDLGDGTYQYILQGNLIGEEQLTYVIADATGQQASAHVTLQFSATAELGDSENNTIAGTNVSDYIIGLDGDDILKGKKGNDLLVGGEGDDKLKGANDHDLLYGGAGDDRLEGQNDDDMLAGGSGDDTLLGGKGDDALYGGKGDDVLKGGKGDDVLLGGWGADKLYGNAGADVFAYTALIESTREHSDTIYGFKSGEDVLDFTDLQLLGITSMDDIEITHAKNMTTVEAKDADVDFEIKLKGNIDLDDNDFLF